MERESNDLALMTAIDMRVKLIELMQEVGRIGCDDAIVSLCYAFEHMSQAISELEG